MAEEVRGRLSALKECGDGERRSVGRRLSFTGMVEVVAFKLTFSTRL
jgi:hypothetical protein